MKKMTKSKRNNIFFTVLTFLISIIMIISGTFFSRLVTPKIEDKQNEFLELTYKEEEKATTFPDIIKNELSWMYDSWGEPAIQDMDLVEASMASKSVGPSAKFLKYLSQKDYFVYTSRSLLLTFGSNDAKNFNYKEFLGNFYLEDKYFSSVTVESLRNYSFLYEWMESKIKVVLVTWWYEYDADSNELVVGYVYGPWLGYGLNSLLGAGYIGDVANPKSAYSNERINEIVRNFIDEIISNHYDLFYYDFLYDVSSEIFYESSYSTLTDVNIFFSKYKFTLNLSVDRNTGTVRKLYFKHL